MCHSEPRRARGRLSTTVRAPINPAAARDCSSHPARGANSAMGNTRRPTLTTGQGAGNGRRVTDRGHPFHSTEGPQTPQCSPPVVPSIAVVSRIACIARRPFSEQQSAAEDGPALRAAPLRLRTVLVPQCTSSWIYPPSRPVAFLCSQLLPALGEIAQVPVRPMCRKSSSRSSLPSSIASMAASRTVGLAW